MRRTAIADPDHQVRSVAITQLKVQKSVDNTAYLVGLLRTFSGERYRVRGNKKSRALARRILRRAAEALGLLGDPRAVPALANAMVVQFYIPENKEEMPPMNIGFSNTTNVGGHVITDQHGNQFVMPATEGQNFGVGGDDREKRIESGYFFTEAAYTALRKLTGRDYTHDKRKWLAWWYRNRHDIE